MYGLIFRNLWRTSWRALASLSLNTWGKRLDWPGEVFFRFTGFELRIIELDFLAWRQKETKYKQYLSNMSGGCIVLIIYIVQGSRELWGARCHPSPRFQKFRCSFCKWWFGKTYLLSIHEWPALSNDYFQNKEALTWTLLLPVWICLSLPHRLISVWKLSNSLISSRAFTD